MGKVTASRNNGIVECWNNGFELLPDRSQIPWGHDLPASTTAEPEGDGTDYQVIRVAGFLILDNRQFLKRLDFIQYAASSI